MTPSSTNDKTKINKADVIGQSIDEIWARFGSIGENNWLDTADTWLVLSNGYIIRVPYCCYSNWYTDTIAYGAKCIERKSNTDKQPNLFRFARLFHRPNPKKQQIVGSRIVAIYSQASDEIPEESALLQLDDGRVITEILVAPHGTGAAGLHILNADEFTELKNKSDLQSFFSDGT